jgi:hypothetical protein
MTAKLDSERATIAASRGRAGLVALSDHYRLADDWRKS